MLESVVAAIESAGEVDVAGLPAGELNGLMRELEGVRRKLAALTASVTAAWDAAVAWYEDGAQSGAAWLRATAKLDGGTATAQVQVARKLRTMPLTAAALAAGAVSVDQVAVLARAVTRRTAADFERDEALLVGKARDPELSMVGFQRAVQYWKLGADPDGCSRRHARQVDDRRMHLSQSFDGWWFGEFGLDPVNGATVDERLRAIEAELFAADVAAARARHGDLASLADLPRTSQQRRADALVEMAVRAGATPAGGRRPAPRFTVLVGYETFRGMVCELENGPVVPPEALVPYLRDADVERIVFDGPARVMEVGEQRTFTGALRRAIQVRDRECAHPLCDVPAARCQIDHRHRYGDGGATAQDNGRAYCRFHNLDRERRTADGGPAP